MNHDELAADLAAHFSGRVGRVLIWREISLPSPEGDCRIDVLTAWPRPSDRTPGGSGLLLEAFEVKSLRADFDAEARSAKWTKAAHSGVDRLSYAVPRGMVGPGEVPRSVGLIERLGDGRWRRRKAARQLSPGVRLSGLPVLLLLRLHDQLMDRALTRHERLERYLSDAALAAALSERARQWLAEAAQIRALAEMDRAHARGMEWIRIEGASQ